MDVGPLYFRVLVVVEVMALAELGRYFGVFVVEPGAVGSAEDVAARPLSG